MEALTDAIGLGMIGLGPGVLDIVDRQVELVIVGFWFSAVFSATASQDADYPHSLFCKERQDFIIEQIRACNRSLGRIEPGLSPPGEVSTKVCW